MRCPKPGHILNLTGSPTVLDQPVVLLVLSAVTHHGNTVIYFSSDAERVAVYSTLEKGLFRKRLYLVLI